MAISKRATEKAYAGSVSRIDEPALSFAEIEGREVQPGLLMK
jgi:hypothetical protein